MAELAFLIAVIFAGLIVLTPVAGLTIYLITRPWLIAYRQRQHMLGVYDPANPYVVERYQSEVVQTYQGDPR